MEVTDASNNGTHTSKYLIYIYKASKLSLPEVGSIYPDPLPLRNTLAAVVEAM